jgi:hypothetical protein
MYLGSGFHAWEGKKKKFIIFLFICYHLLLKDNLIYLEREE